MSKTCAICGKPLTGGMLVHKDCIPGAEQSGEKWLEELGYVREEGFLLVDHAFVNRRRHKFIHIYATGSVGIGSMIPGDFPTASFDEVFAITKMIRDLEMHRGETQPSAEEPLAGDGLSDPDAYPTMDMPEV